MKIEEKKMDTINELGIKDRHFSDKLCKVTESNIEKLLLFISSKNKIAFKSHFDKKGTKKFLSEKEKAMEKIILIDEIKDENNKNKKHHHEKSKKIKKKARRSISDNIIKFNPKAINQKLAPSQNFQKSQKIIINYIDDGKNNDTNNQIKFPNKKKVVKLNSISSNYSNINSIEPLNLAINKNDSLIFSIISEMSNVNN